MQRRLVLFTDVSGQLIGFIFKGQTVKDTNLRCNICKQLTCVTPQKNEEIIYTAAEA